MLDRMAGLVKRLGLAADRRRGLDPQARARLDDAMAVLREDYAGRSGEMADAMAGISEVFGLDPLETDLIMAAAAADFDTNVGIVYGMLRGAKGAARVDVALALELCEAPIMSAASFGRLGESASLRRNGLVEVIGTEPWLRRELRVPDRVLAQLVGVHEPEPAVAAALTQTVPLDLGGTSEIAAAIEHGQPLVWLRAAPGAAGLSMAAGAFAAAGVKSLALDARRVPEADLASVISAAAREAALEAKGLIVMGADLLTERGGLVSELERSVVPVIAVGTKPWNPLWLQRYPLVVEAAPLPPEIRSAVWESALPGLGRHADLTNLRLSPEQIAEAARYAVSQAAAQGVQPSGEAVRAAARRIGGSTVAAPAQSRMPSFDELILPEHVESSLRRLVSWGRQRDRVLADRRLADAGGKGRGLTALFTGNPGTGKTLAAHVVAAELGLDLLPVDLSAIIDKYIGETEKNLERVFHEAESLNVVLFFDEADALFGKRTEVKDAHDRYANQEVAYLLQRMEHFDGITILATNLRGNLDAAFSRRMSVMVHFPDPDVPIRRRLWQAHLDRLPALDGSDPIDLDHLAASVELAGGGIRNVVLAAAYDAAALAETVGMRHVRTAAVGEYGKLGLRVPNDGFVAVSP